MVKVMTIRTPDNLVKLLDEFSDSQGLTRNALVTQILWEWIEKMKGGDAYESK